VSELRTIARHAGTVLVGQLAVMAFGVTDTIVAGRYSEQALAALSVGSAVYVSIFVGLMGVLQALLPTWAELHGAGKAPAVGRSVRQALYLSGLTMVIGVTAPFFPGPLPEWPEVPSASCCRVVIAWEGRIPASRGGSTPGPFRRNANPAGPLGKVVRSLLPHVTGLPSPAKPKVLVAGCGTGQQTLAAATRYQGAPVLAVDLSRRRLPAPCPRLKALGPPNL